MASAWGLSFGTAWGNVWGPINEIESTGRSGSARLALHYLQEEYNLKRKLKEQVVEKALPVEKIELKKEKPLKKKVVKLQKKDEVQAKETPREVFSFKLKPTYSQEVDRKNEILASVASNIVTKTEWECQVLEAEFKKRSDEEDDFLSVMLLAA